VLIALTTGMRVAEVFALNWSDILYREELMTIRAMLKGGKMRYVPMPAELAVELKRFPAVIGGGTGFFRRNAAQSANGSEWTEASR
jgi:integrase